MGEDYQAKLPNFTSKDEGSYVLTIGFTVWCDDVKNSLLRRTINSKGWKHKWPWFLRFVIKNMIVHWEFLLLSVVLALNQQIFKTSSKRIKVKYHILNFLCFQPWYWGLRALCIVFLIEKDSFLWLSEKSLEKKIIKMWLKSKSYKEDMTHSE